MKRHGINFIVIGFVAALLMPGSKARADETKYPIDQWLDKAIAKDGSTFGMRAATSEAIKKWDAEMNRAYRHLIKQLNARQRADLLKSQKAWLVFRDAELQTAQSVIGSQQGTMWPGIVLSHQLGVVRARALQLKGLEDDVEPK